jgi:signal transduction histidine kinase
MPGVARLGELADRVRAAGLPVDVTVTGTPLPLPSHLDHCLYRVVQEALTNALKHAGPAEATVALDYYPDALTVRVTDTGRGTPTNTTNGSTGQGLIGMRERARLYGGILHAGPLPHGGFEVTLTLPTGQGNIP